MVQLYYMILFQDKYNLLIVYMKEIKEYINQMMNKYQIMQMM
jgi:hypothetical protein